MPNINLNVVNTKDAAYLSHNRRTSHFYAVRLEDGVDVVRIDIIHFNLYFFCCTSKFPEATQVRAIGGDLQWGLIRNDPENSRSVLTLMSPSLLASLTRKQSVIPGISRTMVFVHARSTIPTKSSLGKSDPNYVPN